MTLQNIPQYNDILDGEITDLTSNLVVVKNGVRVQPALISGTLIYSLLELVALVMDLWYGKLDDTDGQLRVATAAGQNLIDLFAITGQEPLPGDYAVIPVFLGRYTAAGSPEVDIPADSTIFIGLDSSGNATLEFTALQSTALGPGLAGSIPADSAGAWVLAKASDVGTAYNLAANQIVLLSTDTNLSGVDFVGNPPVLPTDAPTVVQVGTPGTTSYTYLIVPLGIQGTSTASPPTTTTTGAATLNGTNYNHITWDDVQYENGFYVIKAAGSSYVLQAQVGPGVTFYDDKGAAPLQTGYVLPITNTSNTGMGGINAEDDNDFRDRAPNAIFDNATSTAPNIVSELQKVAGVVRAFETDTTDGRFTIQVLPSITPIPADVQTAIDESITLNKAAGARYSWSAVTTDQVDVAYQYAVQAGVNASDLVSPIDTAIETYFSGLNPGDPVRWSQIAAAISSVSGVAAVNTVSSTIVGGATYTLADVPSASGILYVPRNFNPTVGA